MFFEGNRSQTCQVERLRGRTGPDDDAPRCDGITRPPPTVGIDEESPDGDVNAHHHKRDTPNDNETWRGRSEDSGLPEHRKAGPEKAERNENASAGRKNTRATCRYGRTMIGISSGACSVCFVGSISSGSFNWSDVRPGATPTTVSGRPTVTVGDPVYATVPRVSGRESRPAVR